ncbi:hypothetical protein RintRC_2815 [Richelia intracellularis]|nr:hypothetical protein RintRC_2815 [Richelia intracellularis]
MVSNPNSSRTYATQEILLQVIEQIKAGHINSTDVLSKEVNSLE